MPEPVIVDFPTASSSGQQRPEDAPSVVASGAQAPGTQVPIPPSELPARTTTRAGSGLGLLLAATGAATGLSIGGVWGGLSGLLFAGAVRNAYRAYRGWGSEDEATRSEATRSVTAAGFGGLLAIVAAVQAGSAAKEEEER